MMSFSAFDIDDWLRRQYNNIIITCGYGEKNRNRNYYYSTPFFRAVYSIYDIGMRVAYVLLFTIITTAYVRFPYKFTDMYVRMYVRRRSPIRYYTTMTIIWHVFKQLTLNS